MAVGQEIHDRAAIVKCGVETKDVPGLVNVERMDFTSPEVQKGLMSQKRDVYPHEEMFGSYCTVTEHIEVPIEIVYDYLANVYSMEEWTATLREFQHLGGGLYRALDLLGGKDTSIYLRIEAHPGPRAIDFLCAWDQGLELWMRYYYRLLDALPVTGKAGTVLIWTNGRHPYYDKDSPAPAYVAEPRARADRLWVGQIWDLFYEGHRMEASNIKKILEHRFRAAEAARK